MPVTTYPFYYFLNSCFVTMRTSRPPSFHVTILDMAHVCRVNEGAEWLDEAMGGEYVQEDRQEKRRTGRCEGGQEGVKVDSEVCRKARRSV